MYEPLSDIVAIDSLLLPDTALFFKPIPIQGMVGTPHGYSVGGDDLMTIVLLACTVLLVLLLSFNGRFLLEKSKEFFFAHSGDDYDVLTASTARYLPLLAVGCCLLGLGWYVVVGNELPETFREVPVAVVAVFAAAFALFFLLKDLLYEIVNGVLFGSKKSIQWRQSFLFLTTLEGAMMLPMVVALFYFDLPANFAIYGGVVVLFLNKMLTFYKSYNIFFQQNERFLENILYFCALEITPLLAFCGLWMIIVNVLKINF